VFVVQSLTPFYCKMAFLRVFLAVIAATTLARANVVDLTNDNFDKFVDGSKAAFVEFYAPWCGHCKRLAPAYEEVGKAFANSPDVLIAKVDADADRALGGRFGVQGFPTLKFFPKGSTTPEDYNGGRTAEDIIGFINEKSGARGHLKKEASNVVDLTPSNFDSVVMDSQKDVLVEFYAPWCGHCKSLIPVYEELANTFQNEENCVIAKVDADGNREIASKYGVSGYPTIKYFDSDNKTPEDYSGGRDIDSFVKFMNGKCGTNRIKGGSLGPEVSVVSICN
jgi:protein disulfide-isomerase A6